MQGKFNAGSAPAGVAFRQAASTQKNAATEYVEPKVVNAFHGSSEPSSAPVATDFTTWTQQQIVEFLDRRGEDYDDCVDFYALVARAIECERNTGSAAQPGAVAPEQADVEEDPLDAFMTDIDKTISEQAKVEPSVAPARLACDEDDMDEYIEAHAAHQAAQQGARAGAAQGRAVSQSEAVSAEDDLEALDSDRRKDVDPLPPVDHSQIQYRPFKRNLYDESPEIFALDDSEVASQRRSLGVSVQGREAPRLISEFEQLGLPAPLMAAVKGAGYTSPTAIQAQVLPAALSGRDVLGLAQTGSGKTAAFVLPMVVHVSQQPRVKAGESPVALILTPTRELAEQVHQEARRFSKPHKLRCCAAFGGLQKYGQVQELKGGVEVAVATPGRLIDLITDGACNLQRVTMLVVDEVDRCFNLGFEAQVFSIVRNTRPDRQTLLFSATLPGKLSRLLREALTDEVRVSVGQAGAANADVQQSVLLMATADQKMQWLQARLPTLIDEGDVIVFVNAKATVDGLVTLLKGQGLKAEGIHSDLDQFTRMDILKRFKDGNLHVLVATDVASRGLDIRSVKTVVNYDTAKDIDTHVHRVGRTGRAGDKDGAAVTLLMPNETRMAGELVDNLSAAKQPVPQHLLNVARRGGHKGNRPGGKTTGGAGLGFTKGAQAAAAYMPPPPAQQPQKQELSARSDIGAAPSTTPSSAAPTTYRTQAAPVRNDAPQVGQKRAHAEVVAPRGFVSSNERVGGADDRPSIVMPAAPSAQASEAPASWMQKRLQERGRGRGGFSSRPVPYQPPPAAPLPQDAVERAMATAREAAARLTGDSSVQHAHTPAEPAPPTELPGPPPRPAAPGGPGPSPSAVEQAIATARAAAAKLGCNTSTSATPLQSTTLAAAAPAPPQRSFTEAPSNPESHRAGFSSSTAALELQATPWQGVAGASSAPPKRAISAEEARRIAMEAAMRVSAQAGAANASGQTSDGRGAWAWSKG